MKDDKLKLTGKQRTYLIRLKGAMNHRYSYLMSIDSNDDGKHGHLYDSILFLRKIISNGYYHKSSKTILNELAKDYNFLIGLSK